jgi:hypothetical protein
MGLRRIVGILIAIVGIVLVSVSYYIKNQVGAGQEKIQSAQESVNKGNSFFSGSSNPIVEGVGKNMTGSAQKKINMGKEEIAKYAALAEQMLIGGIVLIVLGTITAIIPRRKHM